MPKRTSKWWVALKPHERKWLVYAERNQCRGIVLIAGWSVWDCNDCGICGQPTIDSRCCDKCKARMAELIAKGDRMVLVQDDMRKRLVALKEIN